MPRLKSSSIFWKALVLLGILFVGPSVFAQVGAQPLTVDQITGATGSGDLSKMIWKFVLGDFSENPFASLGVPTTLLGGMFVIFNVTIFSAGMIWLTYGLGSGIIGTAQDGQALGQRINSAWYPIRVVTGISGLVPIFSGFTGSQALIMWIGIIGIGIANMLWTGAVNNSSSQQLINAGNPDLTSVTNSMRLANDVFLSNVCVIGKMRMEQEANANGVPFAPSSLVNAGGWWNGSRTRRLFGTPDNPELCGSITVAQSNGINPMGATTSSATSPFGFSIASVDYSSIAASMQTVYQSAVEQLYLEMRAQAEEWVARRDAAQAAGAAPAEIDYNRMQASINRFQKAINNGIVASTSGQVNAITESARGNMLQWGWISAGAWFATFAEANSAMADAVKATSIASVAPRDIAGDTMTSVLIADGQRALDMAARSSAGAGQAEGAIANVLKETGCSYAGTATGNCSFGQMIVSKAINFSSNGVGLQSSNASIAGVPIMNPIIMFKNMGDYVMSFSSTVILGGTAIKVASSLVPEKVANLAGNIPVVGKALSASGDALSWIVTSAWLLMFVGALMSLYIPMIPFIIWMGAIVGYAASFLEGLIAMPLHSLSHLDTDGEGMGQRTGHGYLFNLNTLVRPALMVLAFFIASALSIVLGTLQSALFLPAIANVQGNSITGVFSIIGLLLIFFIITVTLINSCFELINVIPDQVIGFVGSGNINTHLGKDTESKINGMFGLAVRSGQGGLQGLMKPKMPVPNLKKSK